MKSKRNEWSRFYKKCILCGLTIYKHKGRGRCLKCYLRIRTHRRRDYFRKRSRIIHGIIDKPSIGFSGELEIEKLLKIRKNYNGEISDFDYKGRKLEVKTAICRRNAWKFNLYRQKNKVDLFLFILKGKDKKTLFIYLIPDKDIKTNNMYISPRNIKKFKKYLFKRG